GVVGRDLSLLLGMLTRTCYRPARGAAIALVEAPALKDETTPTHEELQSVGKLIIEDTLLWFRDIRAGGGVGHPLGGGPFAIDDALAMRNSFSLCGSRVGIAFPSWLKLREKHALYLGFAVLNWMGCVVLFGGIYGRPVALGNLCH